MGILLQLVLIVFFYHCSPNAPLYEGVRETTELNWETIVLPKESLVDWKNGTAVKTAINRHRLEENTAETSACSRGFAR